MKTANIRLHYFVEGQCEQKLARTLIDHNLIRPGKIYVLNPVQEQIKPTHIRTLSPQTNVVLLFDTDIANTDILIKNISLLKSHPNIRRIITIPQFRNLEEELLRCTDVKQIRNLVNCHHNSDFKTAFIEEKHLYEKLQAHHFDISKLWSTVTGEPFKKAGIENQGNVIKLPLGKFSIF